MGQYKDWSECMHDQIKNKKRKKNNAEKICGKIKSLSEKKEKHGK